MKNSPYKLTRTAKKWFFEDRAIYGDKTYYRVGNVGFEFPTVDDQWLKERVLFVWEMRRCLYYRFCPSHKYDVYKEVFDENINREMWQKWQSLRALNIKDGEVFRTLLIPDEKSFILHHQ